MKKRKTYHIVLTSLLSTIVLVLSLVPNIGYITILPGVSVTIIHIPIIIGIFLLPLAESLVLGFVFGFSSLLVALIYAVNPLDQAFIMPWISVLPRVLFSFVAFYIIKGFKMIREIKYNKIISYTLVSVITSFSLFFGIHSLVQNVKINNYNKASLDYHTAVAEERDVLEIEELERLMNIELDTYNETYPKVKRITSYVLIGAIVLVLILYYFIIMTKDNKYAYIPASILLVTFVHTILVITSIALFTPTTLKDAFGGSETLINIILIIALSNGLIEAIIASLIATPITIRVMERTE